jgi:hypothetical protein
MSQDCRHSVLEQPIFIAQYHDLAHKMTFKPRATIFLRYVTNYIPGTLSSKQSHKISYRCFSGPAQKRGQQLVPYSWPCVARTGPKWQNFLGKGGPTRENVTKKKTGLYARWPLAASAINTTNLFPATPHAAEKSKQNRQCTYSATLRRVRVTTVIEEKQ